MGVAEGLRTEVCGAVVGDERRRLRPSWNYSLCLGSEGAIAVATAGL